MKAKLLFKYFFEFLMGISITFLTLVIIFKTTILSKNYMIKKLDENNYYSDLYKIIKEEMSYYTTQTGFYINVLDDVINQEELKVEFDKVIDAIYNEKEVKIDVSKVSERLTKNIDTFLQQTDKEVDDTSLDTFVNQILNVYETNLRFSESIIEYTSYISNINTILNIALIIIIVLIIISSLYIHFVTKEIPFDTASITLGILMFIIYFLIKSYIDIDNISFYNEYISEIIKEIIYDILDKISISGIIGLIIGIISSIANGYLFISGKKTKE